MKPSAIKRAVVQAAVKKIIKDVRADPKKGIRRLAELGQMFTGGRHRQDFFSAALAGLKKGSGAYYHIIEGLATRTDPDGLTAFGLNFGFNALAHGSSMLKNVKNKQGFNAPFCLEVVAGGALAPALVEKTLEEGIELGIYSYLVQVEADYPHLDALLDAFAAQPDGAYLLLVPPGRVDEDFARRMQESPFMVSFLDLDGDGEARRHAAEGLQSRQCLVGGFERREDPSPGAVGPALLEEAAALGLPLYLGLGTHGGHPRLDDAVYSRFVALREQLEVPVLPLDLYEDITRGDGAIAPDACFATLQADGSLWCLNVDTGAASTQALAGATLKEALQKGLPKRST